MGKGSAIGKIIHLMKTIQRYCSATVVGVVNDYVYGDMYGKPDPVMFFYVSTADSTTQMYVRLKAQSNVETALAKI